MSTESEVKALIDDALRHSREEVLAGYIKPANFSGTPEEKLALSPLVYKALLDNNVSPDKAQSMMTSMGFTSEQITFGVTGKTATPAKKERDGELPPEIAEQFKAMGPYEPAVGENYLNTGRKLDNFLKEISRKDVPMEPINEWECRIGGSRFFVPPTSISVHQQFKTGSLGGSIRQTSSLKFNSGHSETSIFMKLYFPNQESIWGFDGDKLEIDFDNDPEDKIDYFMSSLRGLITQFKYAPFLPIKNVYLNGTFNITAVALQSMTVSTVPNIPFCLQVDLQMLKFNHKVYMPMIENFDTAIHWGKFRQYIGRGAYKLSQTAAKDFIIKSAAEQTTDGKSVVLNPLNTTQKDITRTPDHEAPVDYNDSRSVFSKWWEWESGKNFEIYYPEYDPGKLIGPGIEGFVSDRDVTTKSTPQARKGWWNQLIQGYFGININTSPEAAFDQASLNAAYLDPTDARAAGNIMGSDGRLLLQWLERLNKTVYNMGSAELNEYTRVRLSELPDNASQQTKDSLQQRTRSVWFGAMYQAMLDDPYLQNILDYQQRKIGFQFIQEWEVPMTKLGLDPSKVFVQGVNVSLTNNLAKLQLTMQDSPAYQHIGSADTVCQISMRVMGETELVKLRTVFEIIGGYARLEHSNAALGFLGVKNVITALCGMKYCMPSSFDVFTIPGVPHVYDVNISLLDFDVFQQKRELLSSEQQAELIQAFTKKNPFLRIQQLWGAFNAYPDFPLAVKDSTGRVIGHLDPDFYYKKFQTIDDDIVEWRRTSQDPNNHMNHEVNVEFGPLSSDGSPQSIKYTADGIHFIGPDGKSLDGAFKFNEPHAGNILTNPALPGFTPASGYSQPYVNDDGTTYGPPKAGASGNHDKQFDMMFRDTQYRNKSGRMIRAFPSYMMWLIDEGGTFAGVKMFDNFYGLQSIIDINTFSSEDVLGDTVIIRLSNLYSRLNTPYRNLLDENLFSSARIINTQLNRARNLASGFGDYLVKLDNVELKPGVRVHLRMGYSANPNALDTVFNGVITKVENGDIITITCQSDAIELGAIVNNRNKSGDSGKIDGSLMSGLWMSEPRDLMLRLLTMGSSTTREMISHATNGMIFSENKYGIRHFGMMLYQPMTALEANRTQTLQQSLSSAMNKIGSQKPDGLLGGVFGFFNFGIFDIMTRLWGNFSAKRDFEIYKRNIYPGNGVGIAQYLGGDLGDGGPGQDLGSTGLNQDGFFIDPNTGEHLPLNDGDPLQIINKAQATQERSETWKHPSAAAQYNPLSMVGQMWGTGHRFLEHIGIENTTDDDLTGFDEVSFRAQTYMKSVWDLFVQCAALLPNYIVAVRPFMERSTIFYGKPHWLYTSGVVPLTKGFGADGGPDKIPPNDEISEIVGGVERQWNAKETKEDFYNRLTEVGDLAAKGASLAPDANPVDPYSTAQGIAHGGIGQPSPPGTPGATINTPDGTVVANGSQSTVNGVKNGANGTKGVQPVTTGNWARWFLTALGAPLTAANVSFVAAWTDREGTKATWNGLATTKKMPGTTNFNSIGVKNYPDLVSGITACVLTLRLPYYPTIYGALMKGDPTKALTATKEWQTYTGGTDYGAQVWDIAQTYLSDPNKYNKVPRFVPGGFATVTDAPITSQISGAPPTPDVTVTTGADAANKSGVSTPGFDISAHPGADGVKDDKKVLRSLPGWMIQGKKLKLPDPDPQRYSLKFGWFDPAVPVSFTDPQTGLVDIAGNAAAEVYRQNPAKKNVPFADSGRTYGEANEIWDEFRLYAPDLNDDHVGSRLKEIFKKHYPELEPEADKSLWNKLVQQEAVLAYLPSSAQSDPSTKKYAEEYKKTLAEINNNPRLKYYQVLANFMQFMWQHPYHRGWLVKTANVRSDFLDKVTGFADDAGKFTETIPIVGSIISAPLKFAGNLISDGVDFIRGGLSLFGIGDGGDEGPVYHWMFNGKNDTARYGGVFTAWEHYITGGTQSAITWMMENQEPGLDNKSLLGRGIEDVKRNIFDPIYSFLKNTVKAVTSAFTGILSLIRYGLMSLTYGLGMAGNMQKQANALNHYLNDSMYYDRSFLDAGATLMYLADNPFTREYGEPVVEIRQPFQRMHNISSFEHIINNGISETTEGVYTQVTGSTNGKHSVTVYFDKGAPSERQVEKTIETDLLWDKPTGWTKIFHPVSLFRGWKKKAEGASDEISAKRISLYHLKESLKDIYGGELIVLGDASIRAHDLIYLSDVYEKMYGFFEVEQVVHQFSPDLGFITSITPNAIVTINDPARFSMISMLHGVFSTWQLRNSLRNVYNVRYKGHLSGFQSTVSIDSLANTAETQLKGSLQYNGGSTDMIKQLGDGLALGFLDKMPSSMNPLGPAGDALGIPSPLEIGQKALGWLGFDYTGKKLLDQHGCTINYLTKDSRPMDAGLGYNHGVAVGHQNMMTLFGNSLRIPVTVNDPQDPGGGKISMNRVLANMGWNPRQVDDLVQDTDFWTNQINAKILQLSNRLPSGAPFVKPETHYVTVTSILDGNTFMIAEANEIAAPNGVRLAGVIAPANAIGLPEPGVGTSFAGDATAYLQQALIDRQTNFGFSPKVALRVNPTDRFDRYGHLLAWVFVSVPSDITQLIGIDLPDNVPIDENNEQFRKAAREFLAGQWPQVEWDAFFPDGRAYTVNWEMVVNGLSNVDRSIFQVAVPNTGVIGSR